MELNGALTNERPVVLSRKIKSATRSVASADESSATGMSQSNRAGHSTDRLPFLMSAHGDLATVDVLSGLYVMLLKIIAELRKGLSLVARRLTICSVNVAQQRLQ
jgi:hypothetical protein